VQTISVGRRPADAAEAGRQVLTEVMAAVYPDGVFDEPNAWSRARRLDALTLDLVSDTKRWSKDAEATAGHLLDRLASYRQGALAAYAAARPLFERALAIREKALGSEHSLTATTLDNLGVLLKDQGDLPGARSLNERALAIRENIVPLIDQPMGDPLRRWRDRWR
jgi:tetratricopeptide (TPR) repeat protein